MKTNLILLTALSLIFWISSSCTFNIIKGSKNYITRDYKISGFNKIKASTVADINYTQSTDGSTSLQIYGPDNIVELVKVNIKDSTLVLSMKKKNIKKSNVKITISSPDLHKVNFSGVGCFTSKEKLETTDLTIKSEGVGDIRMQEVACKNLNIYMSGVGSSTLQGKAENIVLSSQGVGSINAENLEGINVEATSEGVGNISCYATQSIHATTNGVGNISYKGNPMDRQITKKGIGSIKQK